MSSQRREIAERHAEAWTLCKHKNVEAAIESAMREYVASVLEEMAPEIRKFEIESPGELALRKRVCAELQRRAREEREESERD